MARELLFSACLVVVFFFPSFSTFFICYDDFADSLESYLEGTPYPAAPVAELPPVEPPANRSSNQNDV